MGPNGQKPDRRPVINTFPPRANCLSPLLCEVGLPNNQQLEQCVQMHMSLKSG